MRWVHLRMCQSCGHIGCCDNSAASTRPRTSQTTGHPIIRSAQPGEDWSWCYVDELMFAAPLIRALALEPGCLGRSRA